MTVERKREAVMFLQARRVSQRRACRLLNLARSTRYYQRRRQPDQAFEAQVKELALAHPRFGYRRVHILLKRGGVRVNRKRVWRVWQHLG